MKYVLHKYKREREREIGKGKASLFLYNWYNLRFSMAFKEFLVGNEKSLKVDLKLTNEVLFWQGSDLFKMII